MEIITLPVEVVISAARVSDMKLPMILKLSSALIAIAVPSVGEFDSFRLCTL